MPMVTLILSLSFVIGYCFIHRTWTARRIENWDGVKEHLNEYAHSKVWAAYNLIYLSWWIYHYFTTCPGAIPEKPDFVLKEVIEINRQQFYGTLNLVLVFVSSCFALALKFMLETGRSEQVAYEIIP